MSEVSSRIATLSPEQLARLSQELKAKKSSKGSKAREIPRRAEGDHSPLSFSQQRLWFLDQLTPGNASYHVPSALRLSGPLNLAGLKQAFSEIIRRHEVLRTTFAMIDGQPVQVIGPAFEPPLPSIDLQGLNQTDQAACTLNLATQHVMAAFDLSHGPLLRTTLLRINEREHVLLAAMHHIISDAWSLDVLISELAALYEAFSQGQSSPLAELTIQYADFAHWQRDWLAGARLEEKLKYWKEQLAEAPLLALPTDRPRPSVQTFDGARCMVAFSESLAPALKELGRQNGATLFMTMLAAFHALLHRYAQQARILTGIPVANRTAETESLIGFFVNTLVLSSDFADDPTFVTHLERLRKQALGAYTHQDLPFELLVDELKLARDLSYNPLFQVMFIWDDAEPSKLELAELEVSGVTTDNLTAPFDLTVTAGEIEGQLRCAMQYNTALFDEATISRMLTHYEELLRSVVEAPQQRVSRLSLLRESERRQLLREWNETDFDYETGVTLVELFERQVERNASAVAVVSGEEEVTYGELNERANRVARHLQELGVGPEGRAGLLLERGIEMVVGMLAIIKAGASYVPLDPSYPKARLEYMLRDAAVNVVLTERRSQQLAREVAGSVKTVLSLDEGWAEQGSGENLAVKIDSENLAYIIYTSGSTGQPKGVMNTHRGVCNRLFWMQDAYQLTGEDRILQKTPFSFDVSVWEFFWPLLTGARLVMAEPGGHQNPDYLRRIIAQEQITIVHFVPAMLQLFLEEPGLEQLESLRKVICSGEALPFELQERFFARLGAELHNLYGPTEAAIDVTYWACERMSSRKVVPIGKPIANTQIYILDRNYEPVPAGVAGELHIAGVNLARGYHGQPRLTAEKFVANPFSDEPGARLYRTGDLARYLADGSIEFLGRIDNQVKLHGLRLELGEIETALSEHRDVQAAVVVPRKDESGHERLVAYILPAKRHVSVQDLRRALAQRLPDYMVPTMFVQLEELPRLPNGKIDRASLPAPDDAVVHAAGVYAAPRTAIEQTLAEIWQQVLGRKQLGIHDSFFELGGDSILAIQIVARANQAGLKLSPRLIFRHQTIADLAQVAVPAAASTTALQGLATGEIPLTPIQRSFFEQQVVEPHHFNQSVLLEVKRPLKADRLQRVVEQLVLHHDALRLRFRRDEVSGEWQQFYAGVEAAQQVRVEEVDGLLEPKAIELQRGLNLEAGPLMRVALIATPDSGQRLLIVIHHLAVDGVSWQILLDDLKRGIEQDQRGEQVSWGLKTTSYGQWSERLTEYARLREVREELTYWSEVMRKAARLPLPLDYEDAERTLGSSRSIVRQLEPDETRALLQEVPAAYHTQINDALLTALVEAIGKWSGEKRVAVEMEGHGREEFADDLDLSRTVGWFTSLYPVVLEIADADTPGDALKQVKEQLRRVPDGGIGYGVLRYLSGETELQGAGPVELSFNYLGQMDQVLDTDSLFAGAAGETGPQRSERGRQRYALEVTAAVAGGKLTVHFTYNEHLHAATTIEDVGDEYMEALRELVRHCQSPEAGGFTPSDFPLINLDQADLDLALTEIE
jgi:amino acid adenylation domain-containing protein/non-ribosomal peptide synthase protein (TIGR01720 family)